MNLLKSAGQVLATMAPTIATAVGGPFAGMAVTKLEALFGIDPEATPEAKQAAIEQSLLTATPDQLLALKKADEDFQVQMKTLQISEDKLTFDDIANARSREIAVKDNTNSILAYSITAGFFGALGYLLMYGKPQVGGDVLLVLIGSLGTAWTGIVSYYFGSSAGSSHKDATIQQALNKK